MNYYFTGLIILALTILALFVEPAYPRNEYLNEYGVRCGEMEISTERRDTDYNYSDSNTHEDQYLRFTYRKYLGTDCKTSKENVAIKQQLELIVSVRLTIYLTPVNVPTSTEATTGTNTKFFFNKSAKFISLLFQKLNF